MVYHDDAEEAFTMAVSDCRTVWECSSAEGRSCMVVVRSSILEAMPHRRGHGRSGVIRRLGRRQSELKRGGDLEVL